MSPSLFAILVSWWMSGDIKPSPICFALADEKTNTQIMYCSALQKKTLITALGKSE